MLKAVLPMFLLRSRLLPGNITSYSFISTKVDRTQLYNGAEIKCDGDRTEKKVNQIIYIYNYINIHFNSLTCVGLSTSVHY